MNDKKGKWLLILYIFIFIFQPPVMPISLVYVTGAATLLYLIFKGRGRLSLGIVQSSGMLSFCKALFFMTAYLIVVSIIDGLFIDHTDLFSNRLRVINQLTVLTLFEIIGVWFVLKFSKNHGFNFDDLFECIAIAGVLQGICSLLSYIFPPIRQLFLMYNSSIFSNLYVIERRGYGFSAMLLDTYGYGMGLIAGLVLLTDRFSAIKKTVYITLCMLSVLLNARTGFIVFFIAIIISLFKSKDWKTGIIKSVFAIAVVYIIYSYGIPWLAEFLTSSKNITIRWVGNGLNEAYQLLSTRGELNDVTFLSDFSHIPSNLFELFLGSGHNVYGLFSILNFHSDVGYINLLWEFGILGSIAVLSVFGATFIRAYRNSDTVTKYSIVFLGISYFVVMVKAILIGYNPGVVVTYLFCFAAIYYKPVYSHIN